jgi:hypothetical protein
VTVICSLHFLTCHIRFVLNQTYPTFVEKYSKYYQTYTLSKYYLPWRIQQNKLDIVDVVVFFYILDQS